MQTILEFEVQSTPDNSNLQGKLKKLRVIGSSSYRGYNCIENDLKGNETWFELARVRVIGSRLYFILLPSLLKQSKTNAVKTSSIN